MFRSVGLIVFITITLLIASPAHAQTNCSGTSIFASGMCTGDEVSSDERDLFDAVNRFRTDNGKTSLRLSRPLSLVGNRRMLDLTQNIRSLTHSWSNCPYDIRDEKTWSCMMDSPIRLGSGYNGRGYETLYATGSKKVDPEAAVAAWKKSPLHSSIILGTGSFASMEWDEFGVAISGGYATLWFGHPDGQARSSSLNKVGVTAVDAVRQSLGAVETGDPKSKLWKATSAEGRIRIEVSDRTGSVSETEIRFYAASNTAGTIDSKARDTIAQFLRSAFTEWGDASDWVTRAVSGAVVGKTSAKLIGNSMVEVSAAAAGEIRISVLPRSNKRAAEF